MSRKNRGNHKGTGILPATIADGTVLTPEEQAEQDSADLILASNYATQTGLNFDDLSPEDQDKWIAENPLQPVAPVEESVEDEQAAIAAPVAAPGPVVEETAPVAPVVTEPVAEAVPAVVAEPVVEPLAVEVVPAVEAAPAFVEAPVVVELPAAVAETPAVVEVVPTAIPEVVDAAPVTLRDKLTDVLPADAAAAWDNKALELYDRTGAVPTKTSGGNWPVDIRRSKNLKAWSANELLDWVNGEVATPEGVEEEAIVDELYRRYKLPGNWPVEAAKTFIATGVKPAYTATGVLIEDRVREATPVTQWTYLELRSALLKEITSKFDEVDLIAQLRARLGLNETFSADKLLESLATTPTEANMDNILLKAKLEEYTSIMTRHGKNLTPLTAGQAQGMLYKAIREVMKRDMRTFSEGWIIILNWINAEYNTLFQPDQARRGWSHIVLSTTALATFEDLLTLMIHTRNPVGRSQAAKLYHLDQILRFVPNEAERQNLVLFYNDGM